MTSFLHFLHVNVAQAVGVVTAPKPKGFANPNALVEQTCNAVTWIFAAAIIFSIIFVLLAAFDYMRSSGDPARIKTANQRLIFVAIGVAVALIAFLFPGIIAQLLQAGPIKAC